MTTPDPTPAVYRRARQAARLALDEEPALTNPGRLVRHRMADAVVEAVWADAHRHLGDARKVVRRLVHMEREHLGSGPDGHLSERDLAPLLHALTIDPEETRVNTPDPAPDEVRDAARLAYIDHEGYGTREGHNAAADVAYAAGIAAGRRLAVEAIRADMLGRAADDYLLGMSAAVRIAEEPEVRPIGSSAYDRGQPSAPVTAQPPARYTRRNP